MVALNLQASDITCTPYPDGMILTAELKEAVIYLFSSAKSILFCLGFFQIHPNQLHLLW